MCATTIKILNIRKDKSEWTVQTLFANPSASFGYTVELQLHEYLWNHENVFETGAVGWFVGCLGSNDPLRQYFSLDQPSPK